MEGLPARPNSAIDNPFRGRDELQPPNLKKVGPVDADLELETSQCAGYALQTAAEAKRRGAEI